MAQWQILQKNYIYSWGFLDQTSVCFIILAKERSHTLGENLKLSRNDVIVPLPLFKKKKKGKE